MRALLEPVVVVAILITTCVPQSDRPSRPPVAEVGVLPAAADGGSEQSDAALLPASPRRLDIDWLRARFPDETRDLELESLAPKLAGWVAAGTEVEAFISVRHHRCQPVVLERLTSDDEVSLLGRIVTDIKTTDGGRERTYLSVNLGHWLHLQSGGGTDRFEAGKWVPASGWGVGDGGSSIAVLSHVDAEIARWEGAAVRLEARCAGPIEPLPCADGGARPCDRCSDVALLVEEYTPGASYGYGRGRALLGPRPSCSEPCPEVSNPAIARVRDSRSFADAWRLLAPEARPDPTPTLYRSEARCRRESKP